MNVKAVRLHGANDIRIDEFDLPQIHDDEILVKIVSDSVCMSTYKCAILGINHKRVHPDIAQHPAILGHEFAGDIVQVGAKWKDQFTAGMKFTLQPALNYKGTMWSPGYSYEFCGGDSTYCILPHEVMELGCLLEYKGRAYFEASLAEPMSCCIGAMHASFHTKMGIYSHEMGIRKDGNVALLAGAGPMGLGALTYALHSNQHPNLIVMTDINNERLDRARNLFPTDKVLQETGTHVVFLNTKETSDVPLLLKSYAPKGFDDVFVFAPLSNVVELGSAILARDGCLNFFAGPTDKGFSAPINFYDVHYNSTHVIGTTGGNTEDMKESLRMTEQGILDPAVMVTHIGGLNCVANTILHLPTIPGGKKLIYTHLNLPLTALKDLRIAGENDRRFMDIADIVDSHNGLWCAEAERYLLSNWADFYGVEK